MQNWLAKLSYEETIIILILKNIVREYERILLFLIVFMDVVNSILNYPLLRLD